MTADAAADPAAAADAPVSGAGAGPVEPAVRRGVRAERTWLDDGSWVDVVRGWVEGADALYRTLVDGATLRPGRLFRYERWVETPYLGAGFRLDEPPLSPVLLDATRALQARYKVRYDGYSFVWYRDGRDGMAFHRDRDMRWLDDTVVALLVLGDRRPFLLRPRANRYAHEAPARGATHDVAPGHGDLVVMGGATQVGWEHGVPQVPHPVGGRLSVQWRWTSRTGRPVEGAGWRAARTYDR